ncbi:MFS transporter [Leptolyngbya ohadii]|uniref:MFS transporter n=1 Tax=Leptolyngbya ohadii TaxID=1962290 RepID=UPI000B59C2AC|nr:MFS transporter [Leptolyngbya ohadii]
MNVFTHLTPVVRRDLLVLFVAGLLFWSGLASHLPTLPLYIESLGATPQLVGTVMGCFAIGLLASREWMARLADSRGRKIVLLIGMVAIALAPIGYVIADSIPLLMGIRAFHGISIAAFALAYSALVVDLSPPQHRGELIGYMSLVNPLGMALGPAMGGFLYEWLDFAPTFLITSGVGFLGLLCTAQVREPISVHPPDPSGKPQKFWSLLLAPRIRTPAIVLLLVGLTFGTLSTFTPLYIREVGVNLNSGLFYTATAVTGFTVRFLVGPASDRYGRGVFISLSLVLYTLAMLMLWRANSVLTFLLAGAVEGAAAGTLIPMMAALMADRSLPNERGRTFGLCMVGFDAGIAIAGPVFGLMAMAIGYRGIFAVCAGLALLGIVVFLTQSSKDVHHSLRFSLGRGRDFYAVHE